MSEPVSQSEDKDAVENCIRSFIIKSIHAIVQARSGNVCTTDCISDVGARNNLMVFIEEDPEVGATIKQTLSTGFPIHVRDVLAVEILAKTPAGDCVHEVWRFRLDVDDRLNELAAAGGQTREQRTSSTVHAGGDTSLQASTEVVVGDFKPARLFQQLGTLLKSIIVVARLLPAYRVSRGHVQTDYPMFYTLRRGATDLSRLGPDAGCYEIGRLFSGLAVKQPPQPHSGRPLVLVDDLLPVCLQVSVCHRTNLCHREASSTPAKARWPVGPNEPPGVPLGIFGEGIGCTRHSHDPRLCHQKDVRAVFGEAHEPEELDDPAHQLLVAATAVQLADPLSDSGDEDLVSSLQPLRFPSTTGEVSQQGEDSAELGFGDDDDEDEEEESGVAAAASATATGGGPGVEATTWPLANGYCAGVGEPVGDSSSPLQRAGLGDSEQNQKPPGFAFSLLENTGEQPTRLLAQIRATANLDLFKAPRSLLAVRTSSQSSLFDADALNEELERHERRLKEFDDFLADFVSVEPFSAVPPILAARGHFATEL